MSNPVKKHVLHLIGSQCDRANRMRKRLGEDDRFQANLDNAELHVRFYASEFLPHGSGIDNGCVVDIKKSSLSKIILSVDWHHMDEHGYYDGWSTYTVTIAATFGDMHHIKVTGGRKDETVKNCIVQALDMAFANDVTEEMPA